jgi:hypothetical protein
MYDLFIYFYGKIRYDLNFLLNDKDMVFFSNNDKYIFDDYIKYICIVIIA